jgi:hypothetical protein
MSAEASLAIGPQSQLNLSALGEVQVWSNEGTHREFSRIILAIPHLVAVSFRCSSNTIDRCLIRGREPLTSLWKGCSSLAASIATAELRIGSDKRLLPATQQSIVFARMKHSSWLFLP